MITTAIDGNDDIRKYKQDLLLHSADVAQSRANKALEIEQLPSSYFMKHKTLRH